MSQNEEFSLAALTPLFQRHRRLYLYGTVGMALVGVLYTFTRKPVYEAEARLLLPVSTSALGALTASQATDSSILIGIMESPESYIRIGKTFGMSADAVSRSVRTKDLPLLSQVTVIAESREPKQAVALVNRTIEVATELKRTTTVSRATKQAELIQGALEKKKAELKAAEEKLVAFQKSAKTIQDPNNPLSGMSYAQKLMDSQFNQEQLKRQIDSLLGRFGNLASMNGGELPTNLRTLREDIRDSIRRKDIEINQALVTQGPLSPNVVRLRGELDVLKKALDKENAEQVKSTTQGLTYDASQLFTAKKTSDYAVEYAKKLTEVAPQESLELQRQLRTINSLGTVISRLELDYVTSSLEADVDRVKFGILQQPLVNPDPINKNYSRNGLVFAVLGFVLSFVGSIFLDKRKSRTS